MDDSIIVLEGVAYWSDIDTPDLLHQRYLSGIYARAGSVMAAIEVIVINRILSARYVDMTMGY